MLYYNTLLSGVNNCIGYGGQYTIGRGVDIPWVRSSIFHGH